METEVSPIYLERVDPNRNMARFYCLSVEADLFGQILAIRRWGRIGRSSRQSASPCRSVSEAMVDIQHRAAIKRRRGYIDIN